MALNTGFSIVPGKPNIVRETARIRALNDAFRADLTGGIVAMTPGVQHLSAPARHALIAAIRRFDDFPTENDPYEERDFGAVTLGAERYFWKIDYYDLDLHHASPDPGDPAVTLRVMTVMRADEY